MANSSTTEACPSCGKSTERLETKAQMPVRYCLGCGWNVKQAQQFLACRRKIDLFGFIGLAVGLLLIYAAGSHSLYSAIIAGILILLCLAPAFLIDRLRFSRDARRLENVSPSFGPSIPSHFPPPDSATLDHCNRVRLLPRPRPIRFNGTARTALWVTRVIPLGVGYWGLHDLLFPNSPIGLAEGGPMKARLYASVILAMGIALWPVMKRSLERKEDRDLLQNGEVALARVTGPTSLSLISGVTYEFSDGCGNVVQGHGRDIERRCREGNYVLVFYRGDEPQKALPLCGTNYEVAISD